METIIDNVATEGSAPKTAQTEAGAKTPDNGEVMAKKVIDSGTEATPQADKAKPQRTLLDDEDEPQAENTDTAEKPTEPNAEDVEKFCSGIKATDLGDGVTWSDETLKAMAPSLIELTGGDPEKANGVVKAYSDYVQGQARKQQEAAEAFNTGLINECRARFGADINRIAKYAREGGRAIFGEDLWSALKSTPAFANNPDVLERLADYGRRISEDNGVMMPHDGTPKKTDDDVLHRMYGNVKVG